MNKVCWTCKIDRPHDEFALNTKAKDKLQGQCRACCNARRKAYYKAHKPSPKPEREWDECRYVRRRGHVEGRGAGRDARRSAVPITDGSSPSRRSFASSATSRRTSTSTTTNKRYRKIRSVSPNN
eukprot:TRINITY_DN21107_c0_g1_i1.p1 TRINITY_DN21107_c0_g1~~TRINITY_DN21107_c0_g1_i1.p1  ORF type:complete len:125 (-),score=4.75 TRINITY_DN21107_c0_g1_i1:210-584(-)